MLRPQLWLAVILVLVAIKQVVLVLAIPPWQTPDEISHFQYVQTLVERHRWPRLTTGQEKNSREVVDSFNRLRQRYDPDIRPAITILPYDTPSTIPDRWNSSGFPENRAAAYGPAYYLFETIPYSLFKTSSIETRLYAMRLWSSIFFVLLVWLTYRIGYRLRNSAGFAATLALAVGLHPKLSFIFAGVNNDALAFFFGGLIFAMFLQLSRRLTFRWVLLLSLAVGLAVTNKQGAWIFLPIGAGYIVWLGRRQKLAKSTIIKSVMAFLLLSSLIGASWTIKSYRDGGDDLIGAQELARSLPKREHPIISIAVADLTYRSRHIWHSAWDNFGWRGGRIRFHPWVVPGLGVVAGMALFGLLFGKYLIHRSESTELRYAVWLSTAMWFGLDLFLRVIFFQRAIVTGSYTFPNQGRYFFIVLLPMLLLGLIGLERLFPARFRAWVWTGVVTIMAVLSGWLLVMSIRWFENFG